MRFPAAYQSVVFCEDLLHFYVFEFNELGHKQFCVILLLPSPHGRVLTVLKKTADVTPAGGRS